MWRPALLRGPIHPPFIQNKIVSVVTCVYPCDTRLQNVRSIDERYVNEQQKELLSKAIREKLMHSYMEHDFYIPYRILYQYQHATYFLTTQA